MALCVASVVGWNRGWVGAGGCGAGALRGSPARPGGGQGAGCCCWSTGTGSCRRGGAGPPQRGGGTGVGSGPGLGATMRLSLGGHHYVIPSAAVPYLNHGLNWTLFDVSALATGGEGGPAAGPDQLRDAAARPARGGPLPGPAAGLASGLPDRLVGARVRYRADPPVPGGSPQRQVTAGTECSRAGSRSPLAGTTVAATARPDLPMHVLTMTATNISGQTGQRRYCLRAQRGQQHALRRTRSSQRTTSTRGPHEVQRARGETTSRWACFFDASGATRLVVLPHFQRAVHGDRDGTDGREPGQQQDHLRYLVAPRG